ncbi:outer membrane protein [Methylobacterium radiodurans]|uniref:Porin n=1 Tax=Methylobacterium radiodurans TaxID=2202828 RepID=A0A2U8VQB5_9HYPH|nr:outer membrane beta-barrel protein [Methylobacterium radiodurans]AWN35658.1 porin [Methylobacterium radiodurans]
MRNRSLAMLAFLGLTAVDARAADLGYDYLRGAEYDEPAIVTTQLIDWSGVYAGGHVGWSTTNFGFKNAGRTEIAHILRQTLVEKEFGVSTWNKLNDKRRSGLSYGAFGGYNVQYGDVVFGLEGDYTSINQKAYSEDAVSRYMQGSTGRYYSVAAHTLSRASLVEYGTVRARLGYAFGPLLPFVTGGLAVGRAVIGNAVDVTSLEYSAIPTPTSVPVGGSGYQSTASLKEKFAVGAALGAGIDYAITSNIFLRAEYQYILFSKFGDHLMNVNTVRSALAVKF